MEELKPKARKIRIVLEEMGLLTQTRASRLENIIKRMNNSNFEKDVLKLYELQMMAEKDLKRRRTNIEKYINQLNHWDRILK
jgi:hypothetical protein